MKACLTALYLCAASLLFQGLAAEPPEAQGKLLADIRFKAEKGGAQSQCDLGDVFAFGKLGVTKDRITAVEWYHKAAAQNHPAAQFYLGLAYQFGDGVRKDEAEAVKWYRKAAEQNHPLAQAKLGVMYQFGDGVQKDEAAAVQWIRKAAERGYAESQFQLGHAYFFARLGMEKDFAETAKWWRKAAEQGLDSAQTGLGGLYAFGHGLETDFVEAYAWWNIAAKTNEGAARERGSLEQRMTAQQVAQAQQRTRELRALIEVRVKGAPPAFDPNKPLELVPRSTGTGFFITEDGYFITNQHVTGEGATVRLVTAAGSIAAKVVKVDKANDVALLKAEGKFTALPVITSRGVRLGATAATVGFPNTGLQGFAPKLAKGEIASLAGAQDDARHFQISAPIQPGNSGGALVDERGNVIGVVVAKLSQRAALATSGALAENVNYAVKSSYLLSFLESVPEVAAKLKEAHTKERKFEDVVKSVEQATVLVLVY